MTPRPLIIVLCLLCASQARAAGLEFPDLGAIALGRGAADAALPAGGTAMQLNPAALARQPGWQFTGEARVIAQPIQFTQPDGSLAANQDTWQFAPSAVVASYGFGPVLALDDLTVAAGVTLPSALRTATFSPTGPQRYALIARDNLIWYDSLAAAARFAGIWHLGVTLQLVQGAVRLAQAVRPITGESASLDVLSTLKTSTAPTVTAVVGLSVTPGAWHFGLSYRPRVKLSANGTLGAALPATAQNSAVGVQGDQATLALALPDVVRLGAAWQVFPALQVELDAVYEGWHVLQTMVLTPHNITLIALDGSRHPLQPVLFQKQLHDTFSLRAGAAWNTLPERLELRAGAAYESSAFPSRTVSVDFANWGAWMFCVGASVRLWGAWLDVAVAHAIVPSQTVSDSAIAQVVTPSVLGGAPPVAETVGNGTYVTSRDMVLVGVRIPLDTLQEAL